MITEEVGVATVGRAASAGKGRVGVTNGEPDLTAWVDAIVSRHPAVGLVGGVVRVGRPPVLHVHGFADIASGTLVTQDTVFRIGSLTKMFTAVAILQLAEQGLVDLDAPANGYLRAYALVPASAGWRPATLGHLLTHTAGIPDARGLADLRHASLTPDGGRPAHLSVRAGQPVPSLARYYREGLREVVEPGTAFAYTNHGFATLGQIVEDVSGQPLGSYFREHVFGPLGMEDTDIARSDRVAARLATGYAFGRSGPKPVPDREWTCPGAGGIYSTPRDVARFAAALLCGGANDHGRIIEPATLATIFERHYQPDPRIPGVGLGVFRGNIGGHRVAGHDGILPGFNSAFLVAPDDGVGVFAFTNGSSGAFAWLRIELELLLRQLLDLPGEGVARNVPHRPEVWPELCGRYVFPPRISDLRERLMQGGGAQVFVRGGRLMVRLLTPVPALFRGLPLQPADVHDPEVFRLDLSAAGMGSLRVVFGRGADGRVNAVHTDLGGQPWSLRRQSDSPAHRAWLRSALGALVVGGAPAAPRRRGGRWKVDADGVNARDVR